MSKLDFQQLTPDNGAVRDLKELIFLEILGAEKLGTIFNFIPKAEHGKKIGQIGEFGMLGKESRGCNPSFNSSILATSEKTWDIKEWEVAEQICYADLIGTVAKVALKTKTKAADLTGTEYIDHILYPRLELAISKMLMRMAWFGDKNADNVANGGILSAGIDKGYFTLIDGIWKRIFQIIAKAPTRKTSIAANSKTTFDEQRNELWYAQDQKDRPSGILTRLIADAPLVLRQAAGQVIYISQSVKDALDNEVKTQNKGSELQWKSLFMGIQETTWSGIQVLVMPFWDEIIQSCEKGATAWNKPHRIIYTVKNNLVVGSESENEIAELDAWFEKKDQKNYILAKDTIGTLIAQDDLLQVAY